MDGATAAPLPTLVQASDPAQCAFYASRQRMLADLQVWMDSGFDLSSIEEEIVGTANALHILLRLHRGDR